MPQHEDAEERAVTVLNEGVRNRRLVDITYLSRSSDELSTRTIEPYLLRRDDRGWYVEAYDRSRDGRRTFKVAYIKDAALGEGGYEPRAEMGDLDYSLGGDVGVARVWFGADRARWELEGRPGTRPLDDGSAVAEVTYGSRAWLISEILRYRGQAEVLEPATVRNQVAESAQALLREFTAVAAG
jgi:proteasome accessory factor C